ncbi:type II CRISPR RNA-guided endonuclease Cas9 [Sharpea porci]|uniref:type II CRISPR RNA-guided endonuclease Cas9 n=1 Tax=Sharpea porci TaxID=2652286 RepID=UPI002A91AEA0|nr:type II CRISPR RNA-guided endonuclease Cas9 [Sharpea porci]MDY5279563.1 type II CRISPR RNA-guided endonuclease Cas9 [Sharpea porci]
MENYRQKHRFVLATDLGIGSNGWAIIDLDAHRIEDLGVQIFESGEEGATEASARASQKRRLKRSAHRLNRRKKQRKESLIKFLQEIEFPDLEDILDSFKKQKNPNDILSLRVKGLDSKLSPLELFSVLIYMSNNRGYKDFYDNDINEDKKDSDEKEMQKAKSTIEKLFASNSYRTVGEMIATDPTFIVDKSSSKKVIKYHNKKGYQYLIPRKLLENEMSLILHKQEEFYDCLSIDNITIILDKIFFQRNFEDGPGPKIKRNEYINNNKGNQLYTGFNEMIGYCPFYHQEKKGTKNSLIYDEYYLINTLSQFFFTDSNGEIMTFSKELLNELMLQFFDHKGELTNKQLSSFLSKHEMELNSKEKSNKKYKLNYMKQLTDSNIFDSEMITIFREEIETSSYRSVNSLSNKIGNCIGQFITPSKRKEELTNILIDANYPKELASKLADSIKVIKSQSVANISNKYMLEAIHAFESGKKYGDFQAEFNETRELEDHHFMKNNKLIAIQDSDLIRNPVVYRTINQSRKIINAAINKYNIVRINIEVASDVNKSFEQRDNDKKYQNDNYEKNLQLESELTDYINKENLHVNVNSKMMERYKLYLSQNMHCIYTNTPLTMMDVIYGTNVQVDHIIPQSKILDDTLNNKVLVLRDANSIKNNRLPLEAFDEMQINVDTNYTKKDYLTECLHLLKNKTNPISKKKYQYLTLKKLDDETIEGFISRNINDTRYITRYIANYLKTAFKESDKTKNIDIVTIKGAVTSRFRKRWLTTYDEYGYHPTIYSLEDKGRNLYYYHHAIDAIILANIDKRYITLANAYDTIRLIKIDRNLSKEQKQRDIDTVIKNTVKSMSKYHGFSEDYIRSLMSKNHIPAICKNLSDEVQIRIPLKFNTDYDNLGYRFTDDQFHYKKLYITFKEAQNALKEKETLEKELIERFNNEAQILNANIKLNQTGFESNKEVIDIKKAKKAIDNIRPNLKNYIKSINIFSQEEYSKRCLEFYNDNEFATQLKIPYVNFKINKRFRGKIQGRENAISLRKILKKTKLNSFEEFESYLKSEDGIKSPYYIKYTKNTLGKESYTIYEANSYYCAEIYTDSQNKPQLRGIRYVDVRKEDGKLVLLKPLPSTCKHITYLFHNEYIAIYKDSNYKRLKNNGFGAYRSIYNVNVNKIIIRLFSNQNLNDNDVVITSSIFIKKYSLDVFGHINGEIKCGDQSLFTIKKR